MDINEQIAALEAAITSLEKEIFQISYEENYYVGGEEDFLLPILRGHSRDCEQKIQELQIKIKQLKEAA